MPTDSTREVRAVDYIDALMQAMRRNRVDKLAIGNVEINMSPGSYDPEIIRVPYDADAESEDL